MTLTTFTGIAAALAIAGAVTEICSAAPATDGRPALARDTGEPITCHTVDVDGVKVFYREAGRRSLPTLVLLHGATDYPGCGYSEAPAADAFAYSFDHLAQIMDHFLDQKGASRYIATSRCIPPGSSGCALISRER